MADNNVCDFCLKDKELGDGTEEALVTLMNTKTGHKWVFHLSCLQATIHTAEAK